MTEVRAITGKIILEGVGVWVPCYMFGVEKRGYKCNMWLEIFDEVGGIGFIPYVDDKPVGQMVFLPKKYARKIGLPTSQTDENMDATMVIGCLFVFAEHQNKGIASAMIKALIDFCKDHGYNRVEAPVDLRPPPEAGLNISFFPFRKFGFIIDESREAWEFRPETRMCVCDL